MTSAIHKPVLIVIAGPNGSGKTTITSKILKHEWMEDAVYINPDIVAQEKFGDWNSKETVPFGISWTCQAAEPITIYEIPTMNCVGCTFAAYVYFWGFKIGAIKLRTLGD